MQMSTLKGTFNTTTYICLDNIMKMHPIFTNSTVEIAWNFIFILADYRLKTHEMQMSTLKGTFKIDLIWPMPDIFCINRATSKFLTNLKLFLHHILWTLSLSLCKNYFKTSWLTLDLYLYRYFLWYAAWIE
jgi:hypothetical protein